jgi:hypothetical protein
MDPLIQAAPSLVTFRLFSPEQHLAAPLRDLSDANNEIERPPSRLGDRFAGFPPQATKVRSIRITADCQEMCYIREPLAIGIHLTIMLFPLELVRECETELTFLQSVIAIP